MSADIEKLEMKQSFGTSLDDADGATVAPSSITSMLAAEAGRLFLLLLLVVCLGLVSGFW